MYGWEGEWIANICLRGISKRISKLKLVPFLTKALLICVKSLAWRVCSIPVNLSSSMESVYFKVKCCSLTYMVSLTRWDAGWKESESTQGMRNEVGRYEWIVWKKVSEVGMSFVLFSFSLKSSHFSPVLTVSTHGSLQTILMHFYSTEFDSVNQSSYTFM